MTQITAALVKQLRESTGAGMMDCKKALSENDGDMDSAVDWLRKKGLAAAAKKAGRVAAEGLIGVATDGTRGAVVEVNAETDFVARNETFQGFVTSVATLSLDADGDVEALKGMAHPGGGTVEETLTGMVAKIGENMTLRRSAVLSVGSGVVASYVHNQAAPGLGKIGVLVALESTADAAALSAVGKDLAMHVAAASPRAPIAVDKDGVDPSELDREREILAAQARDSGKPEEIVQKMVDGRMRKFYEEVCLLEQVYVKDPDLTVGGYVDRQSEDLGVPIEVVAFARFALGEGIAREAADFAAEVAAQLN